MIRLFFIALAIIVSASTYATKRYVTADADSGPGSLRQTISDANAGDTIEFILPNPFSTIFFGSPIVIDKDLTIMGAGVERHTFSGASVSQGFIFSGGPNVVINDVSLDFFFDGAIRMDPGSSLSMNHVELDNNQVSAGASGAGILNNGGTLTMRTSNIVNNIASIDAGGIMMTGGAVTNLFNCNVSNNNATGGDGGGVHLDGTSVLRLDHCTFYNNAAALSGESIFNNGGTVDMTHTIVAELFAPDPLEDYTGPITSTGWNIIEDISGFTTNNWPQTGDLNADPAIGTLQDNGGQLRSHVAGFTSPAVDAGDPSYSGDPFDTRDAYRIQDGDRNGTAITDIGAYEYSPWEVTNTGPSESAPGTLPNIMRQIDTTVAAGPFYVDLRTSGAGVISPTARMRVTRECIIDGYSRPLSERPGGMLGPRVAIEIEGGAVPGNQAIFDFSAGSQGSILRGFALTNADNGALSSAIELNADNIKIHGNTIGVDMGGSNIGNENGIIVGAGNNCTIGGDKEQNRNTISGNFQAQIRFETGAGSDNYILGNYIALNNDGTAGLGTSLVNGILIEDGDNIYIGGAKRLERNVMSNCSTAVHVTAGGTHNTYVRNNFMGTDKTSTSTIQNYRAAVWIENGAQGVIIGGVNAGEGNIIGGTGFAGQAAIMIEGVGTSFNQVLGNYIGVDSSGNAPITNFTNGVQIQGGAMYNHIGNAGVGNVISQGNMSAINMNGADSNYIASNFIGLNAAGDSMLGNNSRGINMFTGSGNQIGGPNPSDRNYIVGNAAGIELIASGIGSLNGNIIINNFIGLAPDSATAMPNNGSGITITNEGEFTIIGGLGDSANVIANSNTGSGINYFEQVGIPLNNRHRGNVTFNNVVGGITFNGNVQEGIEPPVITGVLADSTVTGTAHAGAFIQIYADSIGTETQVFLDTAYANASGVWSKKLNIGPLPPGVNYLVAIKDSSDNSSQPSAPVIFCPGPLVVRSTADDSTCGTFRSAMMWADTVAGIDTITFLLQDDTIFVKSQLGNTGFGQGTFINGGTSNTTLQVGPLWDTLLANGPMMQLIDSGITIHGINFFGEKSDLSTWNLGNGLEFDGLCDSCQIKNCTFVGFDGFAFRVATPGSIIDSIHAYDNSAFSVLLDGGSAGSVMIRSKIGVNSAGTAALGTNSIGVVLNDNVLLGGNLLTEGNIISGCDSVGVYIAGANSRMLGNLIGTDITGTSAIPNWIGVRSFAGALNHQVGDSTVPNRNIISGNTRAGVKIDNSFGISINGNYIGTDISGNNSVPNGKHGVFLTNTSDANTILNNIIAYNDSTGVFIEVGDQNSISGNIIHSNDSIGIEIAGGQNGGISTPFVDSVSYDTTLFGRATPGASIEIFADQFDQGQLKLGDVVADGLGNWLYQITPAQFLQMQTNGWFFTNVIQTVALNSSPFSFRRFACIPFQIPVINDSAFMVETIVIDTVENYMATLPFVTTLQLIDSSNHGTVAASLGGTFTYTADSSVNVLDSIGYRMCNSCGLCDTGYVYVFIKNSPPSTIDPDKQLRVKPGGTLQIPLSPHFSDINGDLNWGSATIDTANSSIPSNATFVVDSTGFLSIVFADYSGANNGDQDSVYIQVCDSAGDCSKVGFEILVSEDPREPIIYNGFSPNGDGLNDSLVIDNLEDVEYNGNEIWIYNKWMELIYYKKDYDEGAMWDGTVHGKVVPSGLYHMFIRLKHNSEILTRVLSIQSD